MTKMGFSINENSKNDNTNNYIPKLDFRHVLITGKTGSGKTATLVLPILENRIKTNNSIIFYDHKGHEHRKIKALAFKENRLSDVIELGKPNGSFFNIMALLDSNMISKTISQLCGGEGKDPYWSMSASQLTVRIIELHRMLRKIGNYVVTEFDIDASNFTILLDSDENIKYDMLSLDEDASFATLAKIIKTPVSLTNYFNYFKKIIVKLNIVIENIYKNHANSKIDILKIESFFAQHLLFKDLVSKYSNFAVQDSDEASGNNGVLQILNNAIATISTQDYLNSDESNILNMIDNNSIIIIDTQSISSHVYSVFIEALLQKLSTRIKYQIPKEVSIFMDEANRVLTKDIDLYNDTLRESRVELILAIQNENQMNLKFGETKWESIKDNILHQYYIDTNHNVYYNDRKMSYVCPLIFDKSSLDTVEYKYNSFSNNLQFIIKRFMYENNLPLQFNIIYDLDNFNQNKTLNVISSEGKCMIIYYVGEDIKNKTKEKMDKLNLKFILQR